MARWSDTTKSRLGSGVSRATRNALEREAASSGISVLSSQIKELKSKQMRASWSALVDWTIGDAAQLEMVEAQYHESCVDQCRRLVIGRLADYRRPTPPMRPNILADEDEELMDEVKTAQHSKQSAKKAYCAAFGRWRGGVFRAENQAKSNLVLLLSHVWHSREASADDIENELSVFIETEYGLDVRGRDIDPEKLRFLADVYSRRHDVLSDLLLPESGTTKRRPPMSHPARGNGYDEAEPEQMSIYGR